MWASTAITRTAWLRLANPDFSNGLVVSEDTLVGRAQEGDRQAFAALVERYWDGLYRWLYRLTHDQHAAEDLTQETFLKAYRSLGTFRAGSHFRAWMFRIAHNSFLNQRRALRQAQPMPEQLAASDAGPDEQAATRETLHLLARAVERLPGDYRAAFLLRVEQGMSFREIAKVLNLTEETARWRVFKARQRLLGALNPQAQMTKLQEPNTRE
jgi:RNA polymerase sigma-70 factor (ECF subfamily)